MPSWLIPFRLPSAESTQSQTKIDESDPFLHKLDVEEVNANISEYGKWKTAPDLNQEANFYPQKEWSASNIVSWSIENRTPNEIVTVLENMFTCYKTYLSSGTSPVDAVNQIIIGFEGRLRNWLLVKQHANPNLLTEWAKTLAVNSLGQPQVLSDGTPENNYIGKLVDEIEQYFVGPKSNVKAAEVLALHQMKLLNMVDFHAHYEEYMRRLHMIDTCLDPSWKTHFVSTLPKWFGERLMDILQDSKKDHTWGGLYQIVQNLILHLCRDQKQIKKVASANQKYLIDPLCRQFHVFSGSPAHRKNRGAKEHKQKKHKHRHKQKNDETHHPKTFRRKKKSHKKSMEVDRPAQRASSSKRRGTIQSVHCYKCGGNHYMSSCPKLQKKDSHVLEEINALEQKLKCLALSEDDDSESESEKSEESSSSLEVMQLESGSDSSSECSSSCSSKCCCEGCMNVLTVEEENTLLKSAIECKDRRSRQTILDLIKTGKSDKVNEKVKIDPLYFNASLDRNTAQFKKKEIPLLDIDTVNRNVVELEKRVAALEAVTYVPDVRWEDGESSQHLEEKVQPQKNAMVVDTGMKTGSVPEADLFIGSISVRKPTIRIMAIINGKKNLFTALIDSGSDVNAIRSDLVSIHERFPSKVKSLGTISESKKVTEETKILVQLGERKKKEIQVSCVLIENLSTELLIGISSWLV